MTSEIDMKSFEDLKYDPLKTNNILLTNLDNPDLLDTENIDLNATDLLPEETSDFLKDIKPNEFSIIHLNIRSMQNNFENFKTQLFQSNFNFKIICLSETWCQKDTENTFQLPNYTAIHQ